MTPGSVPLALYRGDSYKWTLKVWQDSNKTVPYDLTGSTSKAEIRTAAAGVLITSMNVVVTPPNILVATLTAANSLLLTKTGGVWDLQVTTAGGDVQTLVAGAVTVTMDVTDSAPPGGSSLLQAQAATQGVIRMGRPV